jgi:hypothetical protein
MPTGDATLLPPVETDRSSSRTLDDIGVGAVLGAMIEQRKFRSSRPPAEELAAIDPDDTAEIPRARRVPVGSDRFEKAR